MKQRSTTPVSKGLVAKSTIVLCAVLMVIAAPLSVTQKVFADKYDDQINALQQQVNQYKAQADTLQAKIGTLQDAVNGLENQKKAVQTQIDLNQAKYDQLQQQIQDTQVKITDNKAALGTTLANLYVGDTISPLEMLASSKNIGDYVDKQTYQSSIKDTLTKTIATIKTLKTQLDASQKSVAAVLADQTVQRNSLVSAEQAQQSLLNQTKGDEAQYQSLIGTAQQNLVAVAAQQRAAIAALTHNGQNSSGSVGSFQFRNYSGNQGCGGGGYPYCGSQDSYTDPWALYNRECVSYAAWAAVNRFGKHVESFNGAGNAYEWPSSVLHMGANVDNTPEVGSIAITPQESFTPDGHAMVVEAVLGDGWVHVSQYNFAGTGEYSTMDLKISSASYVHFR